MATALMFPRLPAAQDLYSRQRQLEADASFGDAVPVPHEAPGELWTGSKCCLGPCRCTAMTGQPGLENSPGPGRHSGGTCKEGGVGIAVIDGLTLFSQ